MSDLTKKQIRNLRHVHENAEALADPDGGWQDDLAAVVESGSMMAWQLEQAFPFLAEGDKDELNKRPS